MSQAGQSGYSFETSVLLKGVNNDTETMKSLTGFDDEGSPYYLYQCDLIEGSSHLRTDPMDGVKIISLYEVYHGLCDSAVRDRCTRRRWQDSFEPELSQAG